MILLRALRRNAYGAAVALTAVCGAFEEGRYRRGESLCSNRNAEGNGGDGGVKSGGGDDSGSSSKNSRENWDRKPVRKPVSHSPNIMGDSLNPGWKNGGRSHKRRYKVRISIVHVTSF